MQRSSQAKQISTAGNFAIHSGILDVIPLSSVSIFLLFVSEFSVTSFVANTDNSAVTTGVDRHWDRCNQQIIEISGNSSNFLKSYVTNLRLVTSIVFALSAIVAVIANSNPGLASGILLTLNSATSFLVDIRIDGSSHDSEKL